jgi:hypothetical protein
MMTMLVMVLRDASAFDGWHVYACMYVQYLWR